MRIVLLAVIAIAVAACASIGRPEGGPKDELPPVYVRSNPVPGTVNFDKTTIDIYFDENIKLEDASNKVVVSPAQQQMPQIIANGKRLTVHLKDSLMPNQTYTLDFSDAIRDLNEGNILDGFVVDFATGDSIDSLRISGMVLQAENLEPAQGIVVGAYRNLADSAIRTLKVERICKTNQLGQFTLRNLKSEYYRIFALNDVNRDFHWDRSEDVAFYDVPIKPWTEDIEITDTLRAENGTDSIVQRPGIRYMPNNILLTWFNENYASLYMKEHTRNQRNKIHFEFSTQVDTLPILTIVNGDNEGKIINDYSYIEHSLKNDTIDFWIADSAIILQDSLLVETKYLRTDTNDMITWATDTIRYFFRLSKAEENELKKKAEEKEKKEKKRLEAIEKWLQTGDSSLIADTVPEVEPIEFLQIKASTGSSQDYHKPVRFSVTQPLKDWDSTAVTLEVMIDSVWTPKEDYHLYRDTTGKIMDYILESKWEFETQYRLSIDSASMTGIYDKWNDAFKHEFKIKSPEDYSTLIFEIPNEAYNMTPKFDWDSLMKEIGTYVETDTLLLNTDSLAMDRSSAISDSVPGIDDNLIAFVPVTEMAETDSLRGQSTKTIETDSMVSLEKSNTSGMIKPGIVVELLSQNEAVVARTPVIDGKARFDFLSPATYYARAFIDFNGNGIWDTGNISEWRQPEDVFYYPKKIVLKQNWDMTQPWDLFELPLDVQKPLEIKKNKPKTKDAPPVNDEEEDDGFGTNYFYQPGNAYGNGARNANNANQRLR